MKKVEYRGDTYNIDQKCDADRLLHDCISNGDYVLNNYTFEPYYIFEEVKVSTTMMIRFTYSFSRKEWDKAEKICPENPEEAVNEDFRHLYSYEICHSDVWEDKVLYTDLGYAK